MLNEFKSKLENGEFVYGVFVKTSDPMFNEIIGISGYDYVILDTEHGPTDIENQQNNIRACELRGILPIVRVPYIDDNVIGKALDIGAMGIQISQIRCAEDVKKVIKYAKFYPEGERGVCRFVRAADYSSLNRNAFFKKENEKIIIIQLEGKEAIDNLDEILEVDGYDIIFIGPYDLSQSLGVPGQISHPKVLAAMVDIVEKAKAKNKVIGTFTDDYTIVICKSSYHFKAKAKNKVIGTFTDDYSMVEKWKSLGVQYISYSTDSGIFSDASKNILRNLKSVGIKSRHGKVLDCTLNEYYVVNKRKFNDSVNDKIISKLYDSGVDFIEYGYLVDNNNENSNSQFLSINSINEKFPSEIKLKLIASINYGQYDVNNLEQYSFGNIKNIKYTFKKKDIKASLHECKMMKEKGYNVMMYPLAISEYSDSELIYLMNMCNELEVYSLHIVDSFGSMKSKNVIKYISMMKQYLDESIIIGFHSYNNMQLSFSNATILLEQVDREVILDCSVHGIGIGAGNLNTEIILEYLNENYQGQYNDRNILEINDQFIENIYADKPWGYSLPNYLAAKHQCNTDYAYYLSKKNNLTIDEIDDIFDMLDNEKKVDFDKEYIEQLYLSYFESKDSIIDDFNKVKNIFKGKNVIMICPGKTSETHYNKLASLNLEDYVLVSINFEYKLHPVDYLFVGNSRRMKEIRKDLYKKVIASSNVPSGNVFAKINYSSLLNKTEYVKDNSGLMFLKLLSMCDVNSVKIIGMDGYLHKHDDNYISDDLMFVLEEDIAEQINLGVKLEIKKLKKELSIEII